MKSVVYPIKDCDNNGTKIDKCFNYPQNHNQGNKLITYLYFKVSLLASFMMTRGEFSFSVLHDLYQYQNVLTFSTLYVTDANVILSSIDGVTSTMNSFVVCTVNTHLMCFKFQFVI